MKLIYHASINGDKIRAPWNSIRREVCEKLTGDIEMTFEPSKGTRTLRQIRYFHGPLLKSVQEFYQERDGLTKTFDRIKQELKEEYIGIEPLDWDDGTPMLLPRMDVNGNIIMIRESRTQSLSDIGFEEMKELLSLIVHDFLTRKGWHIPEPEDNLEKSRL